MKSKKEKKKSTAGKISNIRPVSNESFDNFTLYRGIHEFLNPSIFVKITVF